MKISQVLKNKNEAYASYNIPYLCMQAQRYALAYRKSKHLSTKINFFFYYVRYIVCKQCCFILFQRY